MQDYGKRVALQYREFILLEKVDFYRKHRFTKNDIPLKIIGQKMSLAIMKF